MNIKNELMKLRNDEDDTYRFYYDGTIKMATMTLSGVVGWCVIAKAVPGIADLSIRECFHKHNGGEYINAKNIRDCISVRDLIIAEVARLRYSAAS